ncbi:MAG TPA: hypothetical protein ENF81_07260 [Thermotogaceae bacterium]|nr:hypothetical protein [Thermotogaceae bacterium]
MGKYERRKGYRGEYNLVKKLKKMGLDARRVPLSGSAEGFKGDVIVEGMTGEVKVRRHSFKKLYEWLENRDLLFVKMDRKPYLVVMNLETFSKLLKGGEESE